MTSFDRTSQRSRAMRASRWLLAVALGGSALAIGSVHTITLCFVTSLLVAAAVAGWAVAEPIKVRPAATWLVMTGVCLVAYTVLQSLPMPVGCLASLSPHTADLWSRALVPLRESGPRFAPLTLDPPGTRIEILRGVAYLLAFVTAVRIAHRHEGVAFLSASIVTTGVLLAAAATLHPLFGAKKLYGLYEPGPEFADEHIAPLLNPNNLAGYLNIAFCVVLATSLSREPWVPRPIAGAIAVVLAAAQVWVASRGGVIAMLLGATTVGALTLSERVKRRDPATWLTIGCVGATLIGGMLIVLGSSERAKSELLNPELSKFALLLEVARMLPAYGVFGTGRGAFESVFARYQEQGGHVRFTSPEDVIAQWVVEWGVPIGLLGLAAIAYALRPTAALARSRTAAGAWAAVAAVAAQNMADYSSETPGVMLSVVVCAAIVVAGSAGLAPKSRLERWSRAPERVAWVAGIVGVLAIGVGATAVGHQVQEDRRRIYDAAVVHPAPVDTMHELARAAMLRHPGEPYFPFATALRATRARDDNPLPWLGATLERAYVYGPAHLLLARVVAPLSPSQARLEYRVAFEQAGQTGPFVLQEVPRLIHGYDDAMEVVSSGPAGAAMLHVLGISLRDRLPATCVRLDRALSEREPSNLSPSQRAAEDAVADLEHVDDAPWCQGSGSNGCLDGALALTQKLERLAPSSCTAYALEARALAASGNRVGAMDRLQRVVDRVTERVACLETLAGIAKAADDDTRFDGALAEIARAGCGTAKECVGNLVWVAQAHEARGNLRQALTAYMKAYERAPDEDDVLANVARLAVRAGMNAEALKDYQELARRHPSDARWVKAAEEQRQDIGRGFVNH